MASESKRQLTKRKSLKGGDMTGPSEQMESYRKFVKKNFHQVECQYFCESENSKRCFCGGEKADHNAAKSNLYRNEPWTKEKCLIKSPSNTFGEILFYGENIPTTNLTKFVRLSHEDNMDSAFKLLLEHWKVEFGTLCISVIGGAKNFRMSQNQREVFINGLIKAAQTTTALIITAGLNLGITKVVGEAIQESQECFLFDKKRHRNQICCLGISPWGYVANRKELQDANGELVKYRVGSKIEKHKPVSLNPNHTHYIFVDEGKRNAFSGTEAGKFRAILEHKMNTDKKIPVVLLVVEGGHQVFVEVKRSVTENVPVVICEGTGRASDILGEVYRNRQDVFLAADAVNNLPNDNVNKNSKQRSLTEEYKQKLKQRLKDEKVSEGDQIDVAIENIEELLNYEMLITIFNIRTSDDLDLAILYSLIKKMSAESKESDKTQSLLNQLRLCLKWNREDIARDRILVDEVDFKEDWNELLRESIVKEKIEFVELFLKQGAPINEYLTANELHELYYQCRKSVSFSHTIHHYTKKSYETLQNISELLSKLIGHTNFYRYESNREKVKIKAFQDLMIWAILMEKHDCAKFFWDRCEESVLMALVATRIYLMQHRAASLKDMERKSELITWKFKFEDWAIKVLEELHNIDPDYATFLVERPNDAWGNITCLELGYKARDEKFISSVVCQNSINNTWFNGLQITSLQCVYGIFLPNLALRQASFIDEVTVEPDPTKEGCQHPSYVSRNMISTFYNAPQTKFYIHTIINVLLIVYFSYVVLFGMRRDFLTIHEILYIIYNLAIAVEKIVTIATFNEKRIHNRIQDWFHKSHWNKVDTLVVLGSFVAMCLGFYRLYTMGIVRVYLYRGIKTTYSVCVGIYYLRCLRLLTLNQNLGPKMVMIGQMLRELMLYLLIIIIILLSYGVTSQGSYYTERLLSMEGIYGVVAYPYWNLFGELSLDETVYFPVCNMSDVTSPQGNCPERNPVMPLFYAVYIFIGNILLLNVLIAIFSYIFQEIHQNSIDIWKFSMYPLVIEYDRKVLFPAPISSLVYIFQIIRRCKCPNRMASVGDSEPDTSNTVSADVTQSHILERSAQKLVIRQMQIHQGQQVNSLLRTVADKVKIVQSNIFELGDKFSKIELSSSASTSDMQRQWSSASTSAIAKQSRISPGTTFDMTAINEIQTGLSTLTTAQENLANHIEAKLHKFKNKMKKHQSTTNKNIAASNQITTEILKKLEMMDKKISKLNNNNNNN